MVLPRFESMHVVVLPGLAIYSQTCVTSLLLNQVVLSDTCS